MGTMSNIGQPIEIHLQPYEVPTVIAALRLWQAVQSGNGTFDIPTRKVLEGGLNTRQIDVLCSMIERKTEG